MDSLEMIWHRLSALVTGIYIYILTCKCCMLVFDPLGVLVRNLFLG